MYVRTATGGYVSVPSDYELQEGEEFVTLEEVNEWILSHPLPMP